MGDIKWMLWKKVRLDLHWRKRISTIDYAIVNDRAYEEILGVKEREKTESDHVPIEVKIENLEKKTVRKGEKENKVRKS